LLKYHHRGGIIPAVRDGWRPRGFVWGWHCGRMSPISDEQGSLRRALPCRIAGALAVPAGMDAAQPLC
jgi:hypothetical protein